MPKYIVVTPSKIVQFDSHKEAYSNYDTLPKPCGVYEVSNRTKDIFNVSRVAVGIILEIDVVYAVNVNASHFGGIEEQDSFLHLRNMLNNNNYREGTR